MGDVHPHLPGISSLNFESPSASEVAERCDVVFTAVPHGTAMDWVPDLLDAGAKVVDLSADYRLPLEVFERTYGMKHRAFREAVFGMPELHPEVRGAGFVANPGRYPTGASLSVVPRVRERDFVARERLPLRCGSAWGLEFNTYDELDCETW